MPKPSNPYKPEREVFCGDGREQELLVFVQNHARYALMRDNPSEILAAIDEFGHQKNFLMNVGIDKGAIVANTIFERRPAIMVELGGYVGYSTILFADALRKAGGQKYISLEINPEFAAIASELVSLAGLRDFVDIRVGPCESSLAQLNRERHDFQIDLLFLDHQKAAYARDLMLCEDLALIKAGSTVVADNVISPGAPLYLEYVRGNAATKAEVRDKVHQSIHGVRPSGNFDLVYQTHLYQGYEPTGEPDGVEVSVCA